MSDWDVVVIGAGAAGIASARRLTELGRRTLLVEASDRLGGRAHSIGVDGMTLDLGCGWLHSAERNPWVGIAEAEGFSIDRTRPGWGQQWRDLGFTPEEQKAAGAAYDALDQRLRADPPASDRAGDALPEHGEWNGFIDALSSYINGAGIADVSVADYLAYDDAASEQNWRVRQGYGTLIASHAATLPVALATPVQAIERSSRRLRIETIRGSIQADAAVVTVPTSILARGTINFGHGYDDVLQAAAQLPLGLADKLFLEVDGAEALDPDAHLLGNPRSGRTGTYMLRPFGLAVIEAFFGGECARALEAEGLDGAAQFAIEELAALLGSDWRKRLRLVAGSSWARQPFARGSYSHALPGCADARVRLTELVDERIRLAGEACSRRDFSTAHGAYATGLEAAEAIDGYLNARST